MGYSQALEEQVGLLRRMKDVSWHDPDIELASSLTRQLLEEADPYFWAAPLCSVIQTAAADIPATWRWRPESCPTQSGFLWFDRVVAFADPQGHAPPVQIRALGWQTFLDTDADNERKLGIAVFVPDEPSCHVRPYMTTTLGSTESILESVDRMARTSFNDAAGLMMAGCALSTIASCLTFLEQRIFIAPKQRAERHARRRLERQGAQHEPLIRVVELRRARTHAEHHGGGDPVEWSCQWVVSGHWRNQWYPSLNDYQPRWIMPYVKGPEDAPLKPPRAKVFAVVR